MNKRFWKTKREVSFLLAGMLFLSSFDYAPGAEKKSINSYNDMRTVEISSVSGDNTAPVLNAVFFNNDAEVGNEEWVNGTNKNNPGIKVSASDSTSGIAAVTVTDENMNTSQILLDGEGNGFYRIDTDTRTTYTVTAQNNAGNTQSETVEVRIDTREPSQELFSVFAGDITLENQENQITHFVAGKDAEILLYARDDADETTAVSGMDFLELEFDSQIITLFPSENNVTFEDTSYNVFHLKVSEKIEIQNREIESLLRIRKLADKAGNSRENSFHIKLLDKKEADGIFQIVDSLSPKLIKAEDAKADVNTISEEEAGIRYYNNAAQINLEIQDKFLEKNHNKPTFLIESTEKANDQTEEKTEELLWSLLPGEEGLFASEFDLAGKEGEEVEYRYRLSYSDWVGNMLVSGDEEKYSVTGGVYSSGKIVIDRKAPVLHDFNITDMKGETLTFFEDGKYFLQEQQGLASRIRVSFKLEDAYFNQDNLELQVISDGKENTPENINYGTPENGCREVTFELEPGEDIRKEYQIAVSYRDTAGHKMTLANMADFASENAVYAGEMKEGTYCLKYPVVVDKEKYILPRLEWEDKWYQEVTLDLTPVIEGAKGEITSLEYGIYYADADEGETAYKAGKFELKELEEQGLKPSVEIEEDGHWCVKIQGYNRTTNRFSNQIFVDVRKDSRAPYRQEEEESTEIREPESQKKIYAVYDGNYRGTNAGDKITEIAANEKIHVTMYVQDDSSAETVRHITDYSDISTVTIWYDGKETDVDEIDNEHIAIMKEGEKYVRIDKIGDCDISDIYRIVEFDIPFTVNPEQSIVKNIISKLQVSGVRDIAGNITCWEQPVTPILLDGSAAEEMFLVIDSTAPVLKKVNYPEYISETGDIFFYHEDTKLGLEVEEQYFEKIGEPDVRKTINDGEEISTGAVWERLSSDDDTYRTEFPLSTEDGKETEYTVKMKYKDWVGNKMCAEDAGVDMVDADGEFISPRIVIDRKAPEFQDFLIRAAADKQSGDAEIRYYNGIWFAYHTTKVKISFSIEDKYFNRDNLAVEILCYSDPDAEQAERIEIPKEDIHIIRRDKTDIYEISYEFDGSGRGNGYYSFAAAYMDNATNKMKAGNVLSLDRGVSDGSIKDGVFVTAKKLCINTQEPCITQINIQAGNAQNGYTKWAKGPDRENFYYVPAVEGDDLTVAVSVREANMDTGRVKISYCEDNNQNWVLIDSSKIHWEKSGNEEQKEESIYTASFSLDGEENKETAYRFRIEYINFNGNALQLSETYNPEWADSITKTDDREGCYDTKYCFVIDNKAPELTEFHVTGYDSEKENLKLVKGQNNTYYLMTNGKAGNQLQIRYVIDDNDIYFDESKIILENMETEKEYIASDVEVQNRKHTGFLFFQKKKETVSFYRISISYTDQSGRKLVVAEDLSLKGVNAGVSEDGKFIMDNRVVIDEEIPVLSDMKFNSPYQCADGSRETCEGIQDKNTKLYYNQSIKISFSIQEKLFGTDCMELTLYKKGAHDSAEEAKRQTVSYVEKKEENNRHRISFEIPVREDHSTDGEYFFTLEYKDYTGNRMELDTTGGKGFSGFYENCMDKNHVYESPVLVLDTVAPVLRLSYYNEGKELKSDPDGQDFYKNISDIRIGVEEINFRAEELTEWARLDSDAVEGSGIILKRWSFDKKGKKQYHKKEEVVSGVRNYNPGVNKKDRYQLTIPVQKEGNYELEITYTDMAGNETKLPLTRMTYDHTDPEVQVSYEIRETDKLQKFRYGKNRYIYTRKAVLVRARVRDAVSGVKSFYHTVSRKDENGETIRENEDTDILDSQKYEYVFTQRIPLYGNEKDFEGILEMKAGDWTENRTSANSRHLVESDERYRASSQASITINTTASRVVDGRKYYNASAGRVSVAVNAAESFAGLRSVKVNATSGSMSMDASSGMKEVNGKFVWEASQDNKTPVKNFSNTGSFPVNAQNDKNHLSAVMTIESNTGYTTTVTSEPFVIDVVPPTIEVSYNDIPVYNGSYYKDIRVATVTITERNFSSADVVWDITNTEGVMPAISTFTNDNSGENSTNDTKHVCTVTFAEDGDYTFGLQFMDKAGNAVQYQGDPFTIDRTAPVISLSFDNNEDMGDGYYNAGRTGTLRIEEHNFRAEDVAISLTAEKNGRGIKAPAIGAFRHNGDEHYAAISFDYDGDFGIQATLTDMAGNESAAIEQQRFTIDLADPEIMFEGIEAFSANSGTVAPVILLSDDNFDDGQVKIVLTGDRNGEVNYESVVTGITNGQKIVFADFPRREETDDMYTLNVSLTDHAGRSAEKEIVFSVNRFGSIYQYSDDTKKMLETYYINSEQDVVIQETNVDSLTDSEVYLMLDGEKIVLTENENYDVVKSGDEVSWKQYTYTLYKDNFEREGMYSIVLYSQDKADNTSENRVKGLAAEFVMDKTAPVVILSGVENRKQYMAEERLVTLDVKDNLGLALVKIYLNDRQVPFQTCSAEEIAEKGGIITMNLESYGGRQSLFVVAEDFAGNSSEIAAENFLITPNVLIQFINNTPLIIGTMAGVLFAVMAFWLFLKKRKRIKKE